ncbi:hypothetical protein [Thalassospira mesophila]|uniref:Clp protease n=1 Tax=Thalassospira mesophila TaxID=1293891 RepID=A0A1Y2L0G8_9PROT|nr:hypothetical protein [Thalassospira mesophila]OSQ38314.1 hypothetical protein TMES_10575 [Thalassospira mesophila]
MPWSIPKRVIAIVLALIGIAYPVLAYYGLTHFSARYLLWVLLALILARAALFWASARIGPAIIALVIAAIIGVIGYYAQLSALRLYPVLISLALAAIFAATLKYPPAMIERFARLRHPDLDAYGVAYTRALTKVWVAFFVCNAAIATTTVVWGTLKQWTIYNGIVSYVLIGILFIGEWPVRHWLRQRYDNRKQGE